MTHGAHEAVVRAPDPRTNGAAPRCSHADALAPVAACSSGCRYCQALGASWRGLAVCLTCGWVACTDDSPQRHALAHYQETDHPVAAALAPGPQRRWCYVHHCVV